MFSREILGILDLRILDPTFLFLCGILEILVLLLYLEILEILDPDYVTLPWDPADLGSRHSVLSSDPADLGS